MISTVGRYPGAYCGATVGTGERTPALLYAPYLFVQQGSVKEKQIDKSTNDSHMNLFVLRKADGFTSEASDMYAQGELVPLNTLCIFLPGNQLIIRNFSAGKRFNFNVTPSALQQ